MQPYRRAYEYQIALDYFGAPHSERIVVFSKRYAQRNSDPVSKRALVCLMTLPVYISRKEAAELLLALRARKNGAINGLTVTYTRTIDRLEP